MSAENDSHSEVFSHRDIVQALLAELTYMGMIGEYTFKQTPDSTSSETTAIVEAHNTSAWIQQLDDHVEVNISSHKPLGSGWTEYTITTR